MSVCRQSDEKSPLDEAGAEDREMLRLDGVAGERDRPAG